MPEGVDGMALTFGGTSLNSADVSLAVGKALDSLSPEQRDVVVLKVYHGFKFHEIAEILSCPASTIKSRLYSAFDVLKEILAPVNRL